MTVPTGTRTNAGKPKARMQFAALICIGPLTLCGQFNSLWKKSAQSRRITNLVCPMDTNTTTSSRNSITVLDGSLQAWGSCPIGLFFPHETNWGRHGTQVNLVLLWPHLFLGLVQQRVDKIYSHKKSSNNGCGLFSFASMAMAMAQRVQATAPIVCLSPLPQKTIQKAHREPCHKNLYKQYVWW